ncbi:MAG: UDP-N-acetylmuramoyl-L-alanine--D-glutamate ligase [Candidatus Dependentiae bacterium]|nr:UDP-N-acetylmuramoyl-L-alanine--D-glutamate ligase [Candidatus Dependentiae bacterium]
MFFSMATYKGTSFKINFAQLVILVIISSMKIINLKNKKIGIWGLGVVGKSVLEHVKQFTDQIQILDSKLHETIDVTLQTPQSLKNFLDYNDIIISSPGIVLHPYQKKYGTKFISELDLFSSQISTNATHIKTIAITGTVGKTSITNLLQQSISNSVAAGNIGYAMLNVCNVNPQPQTVVLELSSYQLHYAKSFAPDLAIWTNFFPNHLDHHKTAKEYFLAKCNMIKHQTNNQIALLPYDLVERIKKHIDIASSLYLFSSRKPRKKITTPTFYIEKNNVVLSDGSKSVVIFKNINLLPDVTFQQNWLIIIASLHLQNIPFDQLIAMTHTVQDQEHRVEFVRSFRGVDIYNDSKSTVWQATRKAIERFKHKKIALFLGGLSKGTNRSPLIKFLTKQNVCVFAFGKEAELLSSLCKKYNVPCFSSATLQQTLDQYILIESNKEISTLDPRSVSGTTTNIVDFEVLLFSPAGSSFDLFKNYQDRGTQFKKMIMGLS